MNEKSTIAKLNGVMVHYHYTLEYVGYDTLPFLPGWSHYEAMKLAAPTYFEHHEKKYAEHVARSKHVQDLPD